MFIYLKLYHFSGPVAHPGHHGNVARHSASKSHTQEDYYRKWRRLKKVVKDIVFVSTSFVPTWQ